MLLPLLSTAALFSAAASAAAVFPSCASKDTLTLEHKTVSPDGFSRKAITINGKFPSPLIKANKGEGFALNVVNKLSDSSMNRATSIHYHGILQTTSAFADGAAFITQCPISPGHSFLYDFETRQQTGTYWYHAHLDLQTCDGLRGPLVIYDPLDRARFGYDVDDESTIITLADWYHFTTRNLPFPPVGESTLVNGLGRFLGGPLSPLSVTTVKKGSRYRFRIINMACDPNYVFGIEGHSLTVIEADGILHKPLVVDSIQIFAGQRYSFILDANQKADNYWIRAIPDKFNTGTVNGTNSAILRYVGAATKEPTSNFNVTASTKKPLKEWELVPFVTSPAPGVPKIGAADVSINLAIGVDLEKLAFTLGGSSFTPPSVPVLLQILSGAKAAQELLPSGSFYSLPPNKVIELTIPGPNDPGVPHPMHLHGHSFHVIRSAGTDKVNFQNPPVRDVVNTGTTGSNTTIRFITDNSGPWFLHCHIDFHLAAGLAVVLAEDIPNIPKEKPTQAWKDLCPIFNKLDPSQL